MSALLVVICGVALITGAVLGMSIVFLLDKDRTKVGRHRSSNRSGLMLMLPFLVYMALAVPNGGQLDRTSGRTSGQHIGATMGGMSWVGGY